MNLKDKAVDIKGKDYILVKDRILYLSETDTTKDKYSIETEVVISPKDLDKTWVVKATLTIGDQKYVGHAQETIGEGYINKTSALENAETSAVGRACAMAGIGVIDSIASVDEINKANNRSVTPEIALERAKQAIEESDTLEKVEIVRGQIKASKKLSKQDKEELNKLVINKMEEFDPLS